MYLVKKILLTDSFNNHTIMLFKQFNLKYMVFIQFICKVHLNSVDLGV